MLRNVDALLANSEALTGSSVPDVFVRGDAKLPSSMNAELHNYCRSRKEKTTKLIIVRGTSGNTWS